MQAALKEIKAELGFTGPAELAAICVRLARYKKENKELLNYLLFHAGNPDAYADEIKESLEPDFKDLSKRDYLAVKTLRKILRQLSKHAKFTASKTVEADLLAWFCKNFLTYTNHSSAYKPLRVLFNRQLVKIAKLAAALEGDLAHDLATELEKLLNWAETSLRGFKRSDLKL